ncbi:MAG: hypothetical protein SWK76_00240 [Actinomycetota bacterium]|nr:hypothetical protein [Actinomycetota bacterium]
MKRAMILILAMGLMVALLAVTGCGESKTTVQTPEGDVTVTEDGDGMKIETEEGEISYELSDAPTEADLGAPIYPDSEYVEGSGGTFLGSGEEGELSTAYAEFTTTDSYDKVLAWYKDELGEPTYEGMGGYDEASWLISDGDDTISVTLTVDGGEVLIAIGSMTGEFTE